MRTGIAAGLVLASSLTTTLASAANVRGDHPRLLFGDGKGFGTSVTQFVSRCNGNDPVYKDRCKYMGGGKANPGYMPTGASQTVGMAAAYLLYNEPQRCTSTTTTRSTRCTVTRSP
jgi:hypothetical protein